MIVWTAHETGHLQNMRRNRNLCALLGAGLPNMSLPLQRAAARHVDPPITHVEVSLPAGEPKIGRRHSSNTRIDGSSVRARALSARAAPFSPCASHLAGKKERDKHALHSHLLRHDLGHLLGRPVQRVRDDLSANKMRLCISCCGRSSQSSARHVVTHLPTSACV